MDATIRRASVADAPAARAIGEEYADTFAVVVRDDEPTFRTYLEGPGAMWLAERDGAVVGCVVLRPLPGAGARAAEVKRLYVRAAERGAGIANALMDALEAHARQAGCDAIYLDTRDDMRAAFRFYERRGYERIPRYNDNPEATIFMRLAIDP